MLGRYTRYLRMLSRNARLYLISNAIQAVSAGALTVLYTLYLATLGYHTDFIGLVLLLGTIGGALGILPAGPLVDRFGWRAMLLWSDVIGAVSLAAQLVFPQATVILITMLGIGASVAILIVVNGPILADSSRAEERTAVFALSSASLFLAGVVGTLLGGFLPAWLGTPTVRSSALFMAVAPWLVPGAKAQGYELALLITGIMAVPSFVPAWLLREERHTPAASHAAPRAPRRLERWPEQVRQARAIAMGPIGRFATSQSLVGFGAGLFGPYINIYFVNRLGATTAFYGSLTSALAVLMAAASLLAVPLANRLGKIRMAVVTQLSSLPFLVAFGFATSLPAAAAIFLVRGPLMNASGPPLQAYLMDAAPVRQRGLASEIYNASWQIAWAVGAAIGGTLFNLYSPSVFLGAAVCYAASALLLARWFGSSRPATGADATPPPRLAGASSSSAPGEHHSSSDA